MGIFQRIKQAYTKVDERLGGVLPGGAPRAGSVTTTPTVPTAPVTTRDVLDSVRQTVNTAPVAPRSASPTVLTDSVNRGTSTSDVLSSVSSGPAYRSRTPSDPRFLNENGSANAVQNDGVSSGNLVEEQVPLTDSVVGEPERGFASEISPVQPEATPDTGYTIRNGQLLELTPDTSYITRTGQYEFDFFTEEGLRERGRNIGGVLNAGFNPWSKESVVANINNPVARWGSEAVANNPYEAALYVTGVAGAYKAAFKTVTGLVKTGQAAMKGEVLIGSVAKSATGVKTLSPALMAKLNPRTARSATTVVSTMAQRLYKNPAMMTGLIIGGAWTAVTSANMRGDSVRSLQIAMDEAVSVNDFETAEALMERIDDLNNRDAWETIMDNIPFIGAVKTGGEFTMDSVMAAKATEALMNQKKAKIQADILLEQKIQSGTATQADLEAYAISNPFSDIAKTLDLQKTGRDYIDPQSGEFVEGAIAEFEREFKDGRLGSGEALARRILDNQMTAQEIANDEEIRRFALDSNNTFSPVTKLYNEAIVAMGRGNLFGSGDATVFEPPSTLGFGLLRTSGTERPASKNATPEESASIDNVNSSSGRDLLTTGTDTSVNGISQELFGTTYSNLNAVQRDRVLDEQEKRRG